VRFLADESCDFAVVRALRAAGHDVAPAVVDIVRRIPESLPTSFVVLEPGRARVSPIPE